LFFVFGLLLFFLDFLDFFFEEELGEDPDDSSEAEGSLDIPSESDLE
jgi:hypothetical protein